jgi:8-oxo-dGTP diphosphatase
LTRAAPRRLDDIDWTAWKPVDRATLLFVVAQGRVLLIRKLRGLGAGKINAPGGRIDDGESAIDAAIREVEEEIRITPVEPEERGELFFQFVDGYSIHVLVFHAGRYRGEAAPTEEAIPLWTPLDAIPYDEMWADDRIWLPEMLAGRRFSGRFVFDGDAMLDHRLDLLDQPPGG